jgi:hypothetical protein
MALAAAACTSAMPPCSAKWPGHPKQLPSLQGLALRISRPDEAPSALTQTLVSNPLPTTTPQSPQVVSVQTDMRSGKEIAEAFASSRITNPLALARLNAKDPS